MSCNFGAIAESIISGDSKGMTVDDHSSIYVGGLPYDITEDGLRRVFYVYGAVVAIKVSFSSGLRLFPTALSISMKHAISIQDFSYGSANVKFALVYLPCQNVVLSIFLALPCRTSSYSLKQLLKYILKFLSSMCELVFINCIFQFEGRVLFWVFLWEVLQWSFLKC